MAGSARLAELFGRRRFAIKPGLERITALLERLGHPEQSFATIHIVGTNGKGSTAAFLAAMLTRAGYCTGLFTSPHLVSYTERFQVNGKTISPDRLDQLVTELLDSAAQEATFFELTTALACYWFAENEVQIAVLEAGMGGRSDATAAVPGIASIITPVSHDHCQWLGNSLQDIAAEKAGIAIPGTTVISAYQEPEALKIIESFCREHDNRLILAGRDFITHRNGNNNLTYQSAGGTINSLTPSLNGKYQAVNAAVALAAAEYLASAGFPVTEKAMRQGLAATCWPGRMELIKLTDGIELLLDGAHNPAGAQALSEALSEYSDRRMILLLGMMEDKDRQGVLQMLLPQFQQIITVTLEQERAVSDTELASFCNGLGASSRPAGTVAAGLAAARAAAKPGDLIVVTGSLFLVGELKALLAGIPCEAVRG